jgi:SAM-dependent methyltransferase
MGSAGSGEGTGSSRRTPQAPAAGARAQAASNAEVWSRGEFVEDYAKRALRAPEAALFERFAEDLAGEVLELGCGAGRVTGHLIERARSVHALDISPAMIAYCRANRPGAIYSVGDLADLSRFADGSFDAVVASFCVLDVLDDAGRSLTLDEIGRVLVPAGLLIVSSHNLHFAPRIPGPLRIASRSPRRMLRNLLRTPARVRNLRRLRALERHGAEHAILVDDAHEFTLLHYYISADAQARQFERHGFATLACLDLDGRELAPGQTAADSPELHYAARRVRGGSAPDAPA